MNGKKLIILLLEDNIDDASLIKKCLERAELNYVVYVVSDKLEFEYAISHHDFDIVLSDHSLPGFNSIAALQMVRIKNPFMPFILVTGAVPEDFAISIFKEGADNYIMKDNLKRLPSAILKAIETKKYQFQLVSNYINKGLK